MSTQEPNGRIVVINPNSSEAVTASIDDALNPLRNADGPDIDCLTLAEGPPGIETQCHVDGVVGPMLAHCAALEDQASAFVVACFSDPGLAALREQSAQPVLGIAEAAVLTAMTLGQRFGIISILRRSIETMIAHASHVWHSTFCSWWRSCRFCSSNNIIDS